MKQLLLIFFGVLIISCSNNPVPKPDNLLSEEVMKDILLDVAILQVAGNSMSYRLTENKINPNTYIYERYKIDSITFYQNQKYYAADVKKYKKMYREVLKSLDEMNENREIKNETPLLKEKAKLQLNDL